HYQCASPMRTSRLCSRGAWLEHSWLPAPPAAQPLYLAFARMRLGRGQQRVVAGIAQRLDDALVVITTQRFVDNLNFRRAQRQIGKGPLMGDLDHVGVLIGKAT